MAQAAAAQVQREIDARAARAAAAAAECAASEGLSHSERARAVLAQALRLAGLAHDGDLVDIAEAVAHALGDGLRRADLAEAELAARAEAHDAAQADCAALRHELAQLGEAYDDLSLEFAAACETGLRRARQSERALTALEASARSVASVSSAHAR